MPFKAGKCCLTGKITGGRWSDSDVETIKVYLVLVRCFNCDPDGGSSYLATGMVAIEEIRGVL